MQAGKILLKLQRALHLISEVKYRQKKVKYLPHIDKNILDTEIANFQGLGIVESERNPKIIVSLTSFPERMKDIHYTIYSLLNQSLKPDAVVLWLAKEQFPNLEKDIPQSVLNLCNNGLCIKWTHDTRPYKKLIPSLKEYPNDIIIRRFGWSCCTPRTYKTPKPCTVTVDIKSNLTNKTIFYLTKNGNIV